MSHLCITLNNIVHGLRIYAHIKAGARKKPPSIILLLFLHSTKVTLLHSIPKSFFRPCIKWSDNDKSIDINGLRFAYHPRLFRFEYVCVSNLEMENSSDDTTNNLCFSGSAAAGAYEFSSRFYSQTIQTISFNVEFKANFIFFFPTSKIKIELLNFLFSYSKAFLK